MFNNQEIIRDEENPFGFGWTLSPTLLRGFDPSVVVGRTTRGSPQILPGILHRESDPPDVMSRDPPSSYSPFVPLRSAKQHFVGTSEGPHASLLFLLPNHLPSPLLQPLYTST